MDEQKELDIDTAIIELTYWANEMPDDAEHLREYAETFARAVAAFVMDLDALELPQVAALMAEHGVRV